MTEIEPSRVASSERIDRAEPLLFALLAASLSDQAVADSAKVSKPAIRAIRNVAKLAIESNDRAINDLIAVIADWNDTPTPEQFMLGQLPQVASEAAELDFISEVAPAAAEPSSSRQQNDRMNLLEGVSRDLSPSEMRDLAASLMKLADAIDQDWTPSMVRASYHWATKAGRIERNSIHLAKIAVRIRELSRRRERYLPSELLGEPCWQMLLELFIQFAGGAKVSTKSLCQISGCPDTTALRWADRLEESGLIKRSPSQADKRVTLVELTRNGVLAVGSALKELDC